MEQLRSLVGPLERLSRVIWVYLVLKATLLCLDLVLEEDLQYVVIEVRKEEDECMVKDADQDH